MNQMVFIGTNLYIDKEKKMYYYNRFDHHYYLINHKSIKKYIWYSYRLPISFIVLYFIVMTFNQPFFAIIVALLIYGLSSVMFYKKFLITLPNKKAIPHAKRLKYRDNLKNISKNRLMTIILLALLLAICFMINATISEFSLFVRLINGLLCLGATVFSMMHIYMYLHFFYHSSK